jgi:sugar O-acyltransferase (sialic acid O-acetyltransferase NeuD family)
MNISPNLYIYGARYFDVIKLIEAINNLYPTWNICGFLDDKIKKFNGDEGFNYPLLGGKEKLISLTKQDNNYFINNLAGNWSYTKLISHELLSHGCKIATLIHPSIDMNRVITGIGCILPDGCIVASNVKIGNFVTVRLKSLISHDVIVEDYVLIGPGVTIGGKAILKEGCFIGAGAVVMGGITIGEGSVVGAGAVVTKNVPPGLVVIGVPAKPMRKVRVG